MDDLFLNTAFKYLNQLLAFDIKKGDLWGGQIKINHTIRSITAKIMLGRSINNL
jgi:hypothetical protein